MTKLVRRILAGLVTLALVQCAGCRSPDPAVPPTSETGTPSAAVKLETLTRKDPATGRVLRQWTMLNEPGLAPMKHGVEKIFYANGQCEWERGFQRGKPHGLWRRWYENGKPCSETLRGSKSGPATMTFWFDNGAIRMQGPARDGNREGTWKLFRKDGTLAEEGRYANSMREGEWKVYAEDGVAFTAVRFERNVRTQVGTESSPAAAPR